MKRYISMAVLVLTLTACGGIRIGGGTKINCSAPMKDFDCHKIVERTGRFNFVDCKVSED